MFRDQVGSSMSLRRADCLTVFGGGELYVTRSALGS